MIYITDGITNNTMKEFETEGISGDFNYIRKYEPPVYPEKWKNKTEKLNGDLVSKAKLKGKYFIPGVMQQKDNKFIRNNENVLQRSLIVIDIDDTSLSYSELFYHINERLEGYSFVTYTTVSHSNEKTKVRLIVEPDRFMDKEEYEATVKEISEKIEVKIDSASMVWGQHMGLPVSFKGMEDIFQRHELIGKPYPVVTPDLKKDKTQNFNDLKESFKLPDEITEGGRNQTLFKYASSLQAKHYSDEVIKISLKTVNDEICNPPLTDEELEKIYLSVVERYGKGSDNGIGQEFDYQSEMPELDDPEESLPVFEADGKYFKHGPKGTVIEISNFVIRPDRFIECRDNPNLDELETTITLWNGKRLERAYRTTDFDDLNRFMNATNSLEARFTGNKTDLQYVKSLVSRNIKQVIKGYQVGGMQKISKEWYFITPDGALGKDGTVREDIIHVNSQGIETGLLEHDPITKEELQSISKYLLDFNTPGIAAGLIGYIGALFFKERLWNDHKIKFSHLIVSGEAGSGKSQTLENIIIPLLGIVSGTHSASGVTKFVMDKNVSSNNTLSYILDEYKPDMLAPHIMNAISNIARVSYDRLKSSRGTRNQELEDLYLTAPLCMFGEASTSETAVIERSLLLTFSKKESRGHKAQFESLKHSKLLPKLGRTLLNKSISLKDEEVKIILDRVDIYLIEHCAIRDERVVNTLRIMYFGLTIMRSVFNDLGLGFNEETGHDLPSLFETLQENIINENLSGGESTKAAVDTTLELMSQALRSRTYFSNDLVVYRPRAGSRVVGIRIQELHAIMTKYIKEFNIQERFLNANDFKKQIAKTNYIVELSKKFNVTISGKETSRIYLTIDLDKAELEGLDIEGFEYFLQKCEEYSKDGYEKVKRVI